MILAETGGVLDELVPLSAMQCQEPWAREMERRLREMIFRCDSVRDDWVAEPWIQIAWQVDLGDFGVQVERIRGDNQGQRIHLGQIDPHEPDDR